MRARGSAPSVAAVVLACLGCGGGAGDAGLSRLPGRLVDAFCAVSAPCGDYPDEATCRSSVRVDLGQVQADVAAGKVKYDPAQASACIDAYLAAWRTCRVSGRAAAPLLVCPQMFTGTLEIGAPCVASAECVSGTCDRSACIDTVCCAGTCVPPVAQIPVGGRCDGAGQCATGTFCDTSAWPPACAALKPPGGACTALGECEPGSECVSSGPGGARSCEGLPFEGDPCTAPVDDCDLSTDFCDPTTSRCQPRLAPGSPCDPTGDSCVHFALCDFSSKTCVALGRLGDPCADAFGPGCLDTLECTTGGTCQLPPLGPVCP
jgi:hypothetical protein